jgi:predicted TIM-barrel fold metal-dependent hydrolase
MAAAVWRREGDHDVARVLVGASTLWQNSSPSKWGSDVVAVHEVTGTPAAGGASTVPVAVVSADSHCGPRIKEDLRPYCPSAYLDEFDAFVGTYAPPEGGTHAHKDVDPYPYPEARERAQRARRNAAMLGHYDMEARLADMDRDGVAAEIIFHGSQNGEPFPFVDDPLSTFRLRMDGDVHRLELIAVGAQIYNRWLADVCADAPHRRVGLAHLPLWDIDASIEALRTAHDQGLRAVNFPAPRPGMLDTNYPEWEPFWAECEELGMPLVTHCGVADPQQWAGPANGILGFFEGGGWLSRRALHRMIFSGVFERHPELRLVYTELMQQGSTWWPGTMAEYDQAWQRRRWMVGDMCPRPPSEYMQSNVFLGASLLHRSPHETHIAVSLGYAGNVLWGADYPHVEGAVLYSGPDGPSTTRIAMQLSFAGVSERWTRRMLGGNAIDVYGLDGDALAAVAERISAPTPADLSSPPPQDLVPAYWSGAD